MDILIVDDHPLFAYGLKELLSAEEKSWEIEIACSRKEALQKLASKPFKLTLLDLNLGDDCGIALTAELRDLHPALTIAILSANESSKDMMKCIENGAVGYLCKSSEPEDSTRAIRLLLKNGSYFPAHLLPMLIKTKSQGKTTKAAPFDSENLTPRQSEIMAQLRQGKSNKLIAFDLGITEGTVKLHVSAILNKLGLSSRSAVLANINQLHS